MVHRTCGVLRHRSIYFSIQAGCTSPCRLMPKPTNVERAEHVIPSHRGVLWVDVSKLPPAGDDEPNNCGAGVANDSRCALIVDNDQLYRTAIGNAPAQPTVQHFGDHDLQ